MNKDLNNYIASYNSLIDLITLDMNKAGVKLDFKKISTAIYQSIIDDQEIMEAISTDADYHPITQFNPTKPIINKGNYILFAYNRQNDLYFGKSKSNNEIHLLEIYDNEISISMKCSLTLSHFIRAMTLFQDFRKFFYINKDQFTNNEERKKVLNECILEAGGKDYHEYYNLLIPMLSN